MDGCIHDAVLLSSYGRGCAIVPCMACHHHFTLPPLQTERLMDTVFNIGANDASCGIGANWLLDVLHQVARSYVGPHLSCTYGSFVANTRILHKRMVAVVIHSYSSCDKLPLDGGVEFSCRRITVSAEIR